MYVIKSKHNLNKNPQKNSFRQDELIYELITMDNHKLILS